MCDDEINNEKHGQLLSLNCCHIFKIPIFEFLKISLTPTERLEALENEDFSKKLRNGDLAHMIENNIVHINFVPAAFETMEDIEFITRKKQTVLIDKKQPNTSFSILTLPFPVPGGVRAAVDIFGQDPSMMKTHFLTQMENLQKVRSNIEKSSKNLFITVTIPLNLTDHFDNLAEEIGYEKYRLPRGNLNRRVIKMYVYEKSINE